MVQSTLTSIEQPPQEILERGSHLIHHGILLTVSDNKLQSLQSLFLYIIHHRQNITDKIYYCFLAELCLRHCNKISTKYIC